MLEAYGQLVSEGYLEGRTGSGTYVASSLQEAPPRPAPTSDKGAGAPAATLSSRGTRIASAHHAAAGDELRAFNPGLPAVDPNLFSSWWRAAARCQRQLTTEMLSYGDPAGYAPLRREIASYIGPARGVRCTAAQVIVTAGSHHGLALCAKLLADAGDRVWIENPGYSGARSAFAAAGCELIPVPVDDEGLDVDFAIERAPRARLAYVSPSHQYPLGVTMSVRRRQRLLEWAARVGAWIIEDDYDSEFRHGNRPLPTLHALDGSARVLYLGTFSKVLFPALRLGYLVADVGLHVFGRLAPGFDEVHVSRTADAVGVTAPPVSAYCLAPTLLSGLVLGYGHLTEQEIHRGAGRLATAMVPSRRRAGAGYR